METPLTDDEFRKLCKQVNGFNLAKYGVPYDGATGMIFPYNIDHMFAEVTWRFTALSSSPVAYPLLQSEFRLP